MDSIREICKYRYVCDILVADRLAGEDVEITPRSLFVPCGIRGQRIDCAWYFNEISCLSYYLYALSKLVLAIDFLVNYLILHDAGG